MSLTEFEEFLASPLLALMAVGAVISSLIPSAILKWLMGAIFHLKVSFWLLVFVHLLHSIIVIAAMAWMGFLDPVLLEARPVVPYMMILVSSSALKLMLLTLMVPDENGDVIAMWRWLAVETLEFILYIVISLVWVLILALYFGGLSEIPT